MHDRSPRSSRQPPFGSGARGEWAAWLPLLFIGAMVFWTVALGLGGWSLMVVSDGAMEPPVPAATAVEPKPGIEGPAAVIPVQMEESQVPEDVNGSVGNAGWAAPTDPEWPGPPGVAGDQHQ